ncbi:hypothetical protein C8P66_11094 [Humitalea rosea]|uniref:Uncharacterized protein n=1 Tax=Humitalea rosea TaxID=990373 RepID=A0A2W7IG14_9PROT|nr:hypothetical protein [Humitalea rosea]PZW45896.1 hypothetical protein C8P66_11094 [Humitalea rosea]
MRVAVPCLLAIAAFAAWVWVTGPGTSVLIALVGLAIATAVLLGVARIMNGPRGVAEVGDEPRPPVE